MNASPTTTTIPIHEFSTNNMHTKTCQHQLTLRKITPGGPRNIGASGGASYVKQDEGSVTRKALRTNISQWTSTSSNRMKKIRRDKQTKTLPCTPWSTKTLQQKKSLKHNGTILIRNDRHESHHRTKKNGCGQTTCQNKPCQQTNANTEKFQTNQQIATLENTCTMHLQPQTDPQYHTQPTKLQRCQQTKIANDKAKFEKKTRTI